MRQRDKESTIAIGRVITIRGEIERVKYCYQNIVKMDNLVQTKSYFGFRVHQYYFRLQFTTKI